MTVTPLRAFSGVLAGAGALALTTGVAHATLLNYSASLVDVNNLGASGEAHLTLDDIADTLLVTIHAEGLTPNTVHLQHIHGLVDDAGNPLDSTTPSISANDSDGDGVLEFLEGRATYGPVILSLSDPAGAAPTDTTAGFPMSDENGVLDFSFTYDLGDPSIFAPDGSGGNFTLDQLIPLVMREIVVHGATLAAGVGAGGGEADGTAGFKAALPVLSGEITADAVPLPAAGLLMLSGVAGLPFLRRRRKKA